MKSVKPKKLLIMNILDILRRYTDEEHRLSQKDIVEILRDEYDMIADRKSIKRNIMNLIEFGYEINYSEALRMVPNKKGELEESYILSDFYLERDFSDSELRLLIDGLLFSKHIPYSQCKALIEKLEGLSNQYFKSRVKYIKTLPEKNINNRQLFYTIEILDEAMAKGRQVSFNYSHYENDKKLHLTKNSDGSVREFIINPYQIAATNGRYYLICNNDMFNDVANYRLDRITNIKLLDAPAKPQRKVLGLENGLDLRKHMAEHLYMFAGGSTRVVFQAENYLLDDIIDWFGNEIDITSQSDDKVTVTAMVNEQAMRRWALQYALHIKVLSPASLAEQIKEDLSLALGKYKE